MASNPDISRNHMDRVLRVMTTEYDAILDEVNEAKKKKKKRKKRECAEFMEYGHTDSSRKRSKRIKSRMERK